MPSVLSRVVRIPSKGKACKIILLEEIIERNMDKLFLNYDIVCAHPFRIMRNADLSIDEDEAADLLKEIEKQLKKRQWGEAIRLEVESGMDKRLLKIIKKELNIEPENIYEIDGPLDLTVLMKIYGLEGFDHLKTPKYEPQQSPELPAGCNIFEEIRKEISSYIIRSRALRRWWISSVRRREIRKYWLSNRPCIVSAAILPLLRHWLRPPRTASRSQYWWN